MHAVRDRTMIGGAVGAKHCATSAHPLREGGFVSEIARILDQLRRSFERESWHGSAVLELLHGVTAKQAAYRPTPDIHSIEELVLHMTTWKRVVTARIQGRVFDPTTEQDWPPTGPADPAHLSAAVAALKEAHHELVSAAGAIEDAALDQAGTPGSGSRYFLLHGVIQHDLYHAGQIAVLRKLADSES